MVLNVVAQRCFDADQVGANDIAVNPGPFTAARGQRTEHPFNVKSVYKWLTEGFCKQTLLLIVGVKYHKVAARHSGLIG